MIPTAMDLPLRCCCGHVRGVAREVGPGAGLIVFRMSKLLGWWLRGLGRPNAFFNEHTGAPISAPHVLPDERAGEA